MACWVERPYLTCHRNHRKASRLVHAWAALETQACATFKWEIFKSLIRARQQQPPVVFTDGSEEVHASVWNSVGEQQNEGVTLLCS